VRRIDGKAWCRRSEHFVPDATPRPGQPMAGKVLGGAVRSTIPRRWDSCPRAADGHTSSAADWSVGDGQPALGRWATTTCLAEFGQHQVRESPPGGGANAGCDSNCTTGNSTDLLWDGEIVLVPHLPDEHQSIGHGGILTGVNNLVQES
jgi:hypothetical protein